MLPYSREVYFSLFGELNTRFPLIQAGALLLALTIVYLLLRSQACQRRTLCLLFSALWAGTAYFWYFRIFAEINFLAPVYAVCAGLQALALGIVAALPSSSERTSSHNRIPTAALILLALFWPAFDLLSGADWPWVRMLGLHAVPLLLITCASLLRLRTGVALSLASLPLLLSGVSAYEAYVLDLAQDWLPLLAAVFTLTCLLRRKVAG